MSWLGRLRNALHSRALEKDIERELRFHLDERAEQLAARGATRADAAAEARRRFGNYTMQKEATRGAGISRWVEAYATAIRRAWRSLRRTPGFLLLAVGSLAIALGLATTVAAEIESLTHPYLPITDPERLYVVSFRVGGDPVRFNQMMRQLGPEGTLEPLRSSPVVESAVVLAASGQSRGPTASGVEIGGMTPEALDLMGMKLRMGRRFRAGETAESHVLIVPDEIWRTQYEGRVPLDSATMAVGADTYRIVGVLPARFWTGPTVALSPPPAGTPDNPVYLVKARPGVRDTAVKLAVDAAAAQLTARLGPAAKRVGSSAHSLRPAPFALTDLHRAMMGAAVFILLIACANVSALILARSSARRREHALKTALGAGRADVLRDVLAEVGLVCGLGAAAGVVLAAWIIRALVAFMPGELRLAGFVFPQLDPRVFVFSLGAMAVAIGIAAILPALYITRISPADPLKEASANTTGRPARRFQALIVAELSLATVLLLGAALIIKSADKVSTFDFGYDPAPLSRLYISASVIRDGAPPPSTRYASIHEGDLPAIVEKVRGLPDVVSAAWLEPDWTGGAGVFSDISIDRNNTLSGAVILDVGPGFMGTLGLPILEGRDFADGDATGVGAVILDERAAQGLFPAGGAVGSLVRLAAGGPTRPWLRVVGIVPNAVHALPVVAEVSPKPVVYLARSPVNGHAPGLIIRTKPGAHDVRQQAVALVSTLVPPNAPVSASEWIPNYSAQITARRFASGIFVALSVASLILGTAGLVGVLSYSVSQRMREFAIRSALGASRSHIVGFVARDALVMALGGTAIGGLIGLGAAFTLYDWLWGVYPVDATALIVAEAVLLAVAILSSAGPALRATRAQPLDVIRAI